MFVDGGKAIAPTQFKDIALPVQTVEGFPIHQYTIGVSCVPAIPLNVARSRHRGSVLQGIALDPALYRLVRKTLRAFEVSESQKVEMIKYGGLDYLLTSNVSGPYQSCYVTLLCTTYTSLTKADSSDWTLPEGSPSW